MFPNIIELMDLREYYSRPALFEGDLGNYFVGVPIQTLYK